MRLPNLNALRAFEAAARLLSMKAAAVELHVSPSAVSQLVRALEDELQVELFERRGRRLALASAGQILLPSLRTGFQLAGDAVARIRGEQSSGLLRVSATGFIAEAWLLPRLPDFIARHPSIDVHISTGIALASLAGGEADVAIRHGLGGYQGMASDRLFAPPVVPVAAPALVDQLGFPGSPEALLEWPLLHDADRGAWAMWFAQNGVSGAGVARGSSFDDASLLRSAATAGQGAALLPELLTAPLVNAGQLVAVGPAALIDRLAYYLVIPDSAAGRSRVARFREWLLCQAEMSRTMADH